MKDFDYEDEARQCPLDFESHLDSPTNRAELFTAAFSLVLQYYHCGDSIGGIAYDPHTATYE